MKNSSSFCLYIQRDFFWLKIVIKHKTFYFSENLQASFSFSRPPCISGLLWDFVGLTTSSSLLLSKKYLQNREISLGRCPTRVRHSIFPLISQSLIAYGSNTFILSCLMVSFYPNFGDQILFGIFEISSKHSE